MIIIVLHGIPLFLKYVHTGSYDVSPPGYLTQYHTQGKYPGYKVRGHSIYITVCLKPQCDVISWLQTPQNPSLSPPCFTIENYVYNLLFSFTGSIVVLDVIYRLKSLYLIVPVCINSTINYNTASLAVVADQFLHSQSKNNNVGLAL